MFKNRCVNCSDSIVFVKGVGYVNLANQKCTPSKRVTVPHIPIRNS